MEKEELISRYGIDLKNLEQDQLKLSKGLKLKDEIDISNISTIGAIENLIVRGRIISAMIVCDKNYEILEQEYFLDKLRFPYLHGFRSYREVPPMSSVYNKIEDKPDIILVKGEGINHIRLGLATHLSVITRIPVIGISDKLFEGNVVEGDDILMAGDKVGKVFVSKEGSKPLYICPGDMISVESAYKFVKDLIVPPHKMPEPISLAHKYAKSIRSELRID